MIGFDRASAARGGRIYAGWHGRTFVAAIAFRNRGVWTIVSQSRDGEMQNKIFTRFGFNTIRGSSKRGGIQALAESIRVLKKGAEMAFTPDGPRGPSGIVQAGIMMMAQRTGATLFPVGVAASRPWHAPTWDRYMVPLPFSKCVMIFGEGITVPKDADDQDVENLRLRLEHDMHVLEHRAEKLMGLRKR